MASYQLVAGLPPLELDAGYTVTFEAIDPDSGAAVTGVTVSAATLYVTKDATAVVAVTTPTLLAFEPLV